MDKLDLLIRDGEVWTPGGFVAADIAVHQGKIVALGKPPVLPESADSVINAKGKKVIPGLIDTHTHHRDPGFTHKEDMTIATIASPPVSSRPKETACLVCSRTLRASRQCHSRNSTSTATAS